jgi:hypothetical protein
LIRPPVPFLIFPFPSPHSFKHFYFSFFTTIQANMLRQSIVKAVRPALSSVNSRAAFTTTSRVMDAGDTGAPKTTAKA